jgi:hypothetical protein
MAHLKGKTEEERQEEFKNLVGLKTVERLQNVWNDSYPNGFGKDKQQVFKEKAKTKGFWDFEVEAFLEL